MSGCSGGGAPRQTVRGRKRLGDWTVLEDRTKAAATFCRRSMQMEHTKKSHPVVGLIILIVLGYLVYQAISSIT